jgi:hypothetical protein
VVVVLFWFNRFLTGNFLFCSLCLRDAHQLFQRLESYARDYILEVKVRLLQQLTSGHNTPDQARAFVGLMLEEYLKLCVSAKILSEIFNKLVRWFAFCWVYRWALREMFDLFISVVLL